MVHYVVRLHIWVSGRVQGVWFRQSCSEQARWRGVAGWVRNRRDGKVEAVFEGDRHAVEAMVEWCRHGPPGAGVTGVDVQSEEPEALVGFRVATTA